MEKVVVLTGGASGIGRGILDEAIARGWRCAVFDLPGSGLEALRTKTEGVLCIGIDITVEADVRAAIEKVMENFGRIDGVVNCAGIGQNVAIEDTTSAQFLSILNVNVVGSFNVSQAAVGRMEAGAIVNITSVSGMQGNVGRVAYGASKGAANTMTRIMAVELASRGIRVNAIAPGPVETPMTERWHDAVTRQNWVSRVPLGRYGRIEEIAKMTLHLLGEDASYVNGQILAVDGGFSIAGLMQFDS